MPENNGGFTETVVRFCHIANKNIDLQRHYSDGNCKIFCLIQSECKKCDGCHKTPFSKNSNLPKD